MAYKVVTTTPRAGYAFEYERESLDAIGAEIVVVPVRERGAVAAAVADADALMMGAGMNATPALIGGLGQCKGHHQRRRRGGSDRHRRGYRGEHSGRERAGRLAERSGRPRDDAAAGLDPQNWCTPMRSPRAAAGPRCIRSCGRCRGFRARRSGWWRSANIARNVAKRAQGVRDERDSRSIRWWTARLCRPRGREALARRPTQGVGLRVGARAAQPPHSPHAERGPFALMKPSAILVNTGAAGSSTSRP